MLISTVAGQLKREAANRSVFKLLSLILKFTGKRPVQHNYHYDKPANKGNNRKPSTESYYDQPSAEELEINDNYPETTDGYPEYPTHNADENPFDMPTTYRPYMNVSFNDAPDAVYGLRVRTRKDYDDCFEDCNAKNDMFISDVCDIMYSVSQILYHVLIHLI